MRKKLKTLWLRKNRDVIILRFIRSDDAKTISEILGISVPTVYARIRKAREFIGKYLEEEQYD